MVYNFGQLDPVTSDFHQIVYNNNLSDLDAFLRGLLGKICLNPKSRRKKYKFTVLFLFFWAKKIEKKMKKLEKSENLLILTQFLERVVVFYLEFFWISIKFFLDFFDFHRAFPIFFDFSWTFPNALGKFLKKPEKIRKGSVKVQKIWGKSDENSENLSQFRDNSSPKTTPLYNFSNYNHNWTSYPHFLKTLGVLPHQHQFSPAWSR